MKIIYIITGLGLGGAETQVANLCDNMVNIYKNDVHLIYMTGPMIVKPESSKVKIYNLKITKKNPFSFISAFFKAKKIMNDVKPDIIHSHMIHANIFARILRIFTPVPKLICTAHSSFEGGALRMLAYRITDDLCDMTTNISEIASKSLIAKGAFLKRKTLTVYNGIDTNLYKFNQSQRICIREELGIKESDYLILNVARLDISKDQKNLINAFNELLKSKPNCHLFIAGDGPLKKSLLSLTEALKLTNKVHFLGTKTNIPDLLSAADVFVLSSKWEGFSLVVAEALSNECLCVATNSGGQYEIINGTGNKLVPPMDPILLAKGIKDLIELDDNDKSAIKLSSRERIIAKFSMDTISQKWIDLYTPR